MPPHFSKGHDGLSRAMVVCSSPISRFAPIGEQGSGPEAALSSTQGHGLAVGAGAARTIGAEGRSNRPWLALDAACRTVAPQRYLKLDHYCRKAILTNLTYV